MKILSLDDHPIFSQGLKASLSAYMQECDITSALNAQEALALLKKNTDFDLLILDLSMPDMNGVSFMKSLISRKIDIPVVIMSAKEDLVTLSECLSLGALGFLPKTWTVNQLSEALTKIINGEIVIPDHIANSLAIMSKNSIENTQSSLSERQLEILKMVQSGLTNAGIAAVLYISEATVKSHLQRIFKILGAKNRMDCIRKAEHLRVLPALR
ncbi:response regulator transcription factor [Colwellia sp. 6_MG-2023]|uniref:response regulator n=1 Tax=Colwellia sp. 6_MG-2023 TaxID=3062676 RepID=UPI0026E48D89|nr:response regulator transcription factor [Colwellia sp. 6_MG-2023]MDO6489406.1 response regulator transcription factor [Colwellia sp. 6_MG-2023]